MKKFLSNTKNGLVSMARRAKRGLKSMADKARYKLTMFYLNSRGLLRSQSGEGYVDTAIKILIAVVIGALLLAGLYALFGETVLPTLKKRIQDMFNYGG